MEEKTYRVMKGCGISNIIFGVIGIVTGITCGVLLIVSGAKLLANKKNIIF